MKKLIILLLSAVFVGFSGFSSVPALAEASNEAEYKVVGNYADGDYIISNVNVTDYGAIANDGKDDSQAFNDALSAAKSQGGGVVYAPAGVYNFSKTITVPSLVTLCGEWAEPGKKMEDQTVLSVDYDSNGITGSLSYFIKLGGSSAVMELCVYYSKQNASAPIEYPYTIGTDQALTTVRNVTLFNSYNGVTLTTATHAENLYMTAFNIGLKNAPNYEISNFVNINVSGKYLNWYDKTPKGDVKQGTADCKAVVTSKCDDLFMYNITIDEEYYNNTIYLEKVPAASAGGTSEQAYGHIFQAHGATISKVDPEYRLVASYEDEIAGATEYFHVVQNGKYPTKTQVFNVFDYGAAVGGDSTEAVKQAISAASANGGGTVFFPAGSYVISQKISVPANVELRGAWDSPMHCSGSKLIINYGKGNGDDCVFDIADGSGVHGFSVQAKDMSYQSEEDLKNSVYPWVFRISGDNAWVENITFVNAWNGIQVDGSDGFLIKGVWGTCINQNVHAYNDSKNGVIEYVMCTYGTWWENTLRDPVATQNLIPFTYANNVGLTLGNVQNVAVLSFSSFGIRTALVAGSNEGERAENVRIIRLVADLPQGTNHVEVYSAENIAIIGLSTGGGAVGSRFVRLHNGKNPVGNKPTVNRVRVYGQITWSGGSGMVIYDTDKYDYYAYTSRSEEVDIIEFNFSWEDLPSSVPWLWIAVAGGGVILIAGVVVALILIKKKNKN